MSERKPVIVVGAGPVGLTTALGLDFYGLPFLLFEDDAELSRDTKAGTILTRNDRSLSALWRRRRGLGQGIAGRRDRRRRARDQYCAAVGADGPARRRHALPVCHQHAPASPRADPERCHRSAPARCAPSAASPDIVSTDRRRRSRKFRDFRRQPRRRGLLPPGLRRRAQSRCARSSASRWRASCSDVR